MSFSFPRVSCVVVVFGLVVSLFACNIYSKTRDVLSFSFPLVSCVVVVFCHSSRCFVPFLWHYCLSFCLSCVALDVFDISLCLRVLLLCVFVLWFVCGVSVALWSCCQV